MADITYALKLRGLLSPKEAPNWLSTLSSKHWDTRVLNGIRVFLARPVLPNRVPLLTADDTYCSRRVNEEVKHSKHAEPPGNYVTDYSSWKRTTLQHIVDENNQWSERYAGATSQILALQFIEAIMETMRGATSRDIEPFLVKLCDILRTPVAHTEEQTTAAPGGATPTHSSDDEWLNTRNRMMFESVQLMHAFTTENHSLLYPLEGAVNAMDNFIESLLNSLVDEDLECNILQSIWNLLQVNAITGERLT